MCDGYNGFFGCNGFLPPVSLISATHGRLPADENIDADYLFADVKNHLKHTIRAVDNALQGQEHPENLELNVSKDSFDPLFCRLGLGQLSFEMACKALCEETAHKRTNSIPNKFSSHYSLEAKAVLVLAAFALNYKYFSVPAQLHSSRQVIESMEISKHVPATLKHLDLQKCKEKISELNTLINDVLDYSESVFELKKLSTNNYIKDKPYVVDRISDGFYWIMIAAVGCTSQMCHLTSDEDKPFAEKISRILSNLKYWMCCLTSEKFKLTQDLSDFAKEIGRCHSDLQECILDVQFRIENERARRKLKELLQTPDEIVEVFKGLIFSKDDNQSLFDGSTKEMVSINVLEKKNVLLFISSPNISSDDISTLISIYIGIRKKKDTFKIVWIPIVEQWTYELRMKFEMLRSDMPWYIVQYFSPIAGIKFIKEDWHFDNEPIVVVMNSQGDVENKDALNLIRECRMNAFPFTPPKPVSCEDFINPPGPHQNEVCTFYCGGKDNLWIYQFFENFNAVAKDPMIAEAENIVISFYFVGKDCKAQHFAKEIREILRPLKLQYCEEEDIQELLRPFKLRHFDKEIQELLRPFRNEPRWAVFMNGSNEVISSHGTTILAFLKIFKRWKGYLRKKRRIETCFKGFLRAGHLPSTSNWV